MDTLISEIADKNTVLNYILIILAGVLLGFIIHLVDFWLLGLHNKRKPSILREQVLKWLRTPTMFLLPLLGAYASLSFLKVDPSWYRLTEIIIIGNLAWCLIVSIRVVEEIVKEKFKIKAHHKAKDRKVLTQLRFLKSIATVVILTIAIAAMLWNIPQVRQLGETILTSAGVLGIIVGVAAQKSIANLVSGFQLAFTQPIKINDEVVIEGEFGTVEDVTLTYVVIKTWDWRRLVLPLNYFNEKPFVNWTFNSKPIIASVFFYLDYTFCVPELRTKLMEILKDNPLWSGKTAQLLVTDTNDRAMQLRATFSVKNAADAWNLRCMVREELLSFIQNNHPDAFPKIRRMDTEEA